MNIYYISASIIPSDTANSVHVMKMAQAFSRLGHEVTLFARRGVGADDGVFSYYGVDPVFRVVTLSHPNGRTLGALQYCFRIVQSSRQLGEPDLFYARHLGGLLAVSAWGVPMIFEAHAPPKTALHTAALRWLSRLSNFQRLVVISAALREEYMRLLPTLDPTRIIVAHDAADIPSRGFQEEARLDTVPFRRNGRLQVGYVGHLYSGRGIDIILALAERLPRMDFHIVGGTPGDIEYWRDRAQCPNLYFHGHKPPSELWKYYSWFDVVLAPYQRRVSLRGGKGDTSRWMSPMKIFEYMSFGKAIVASDLPVLREVLKDGVNCRLVTPDSVEEWVKALVDLERSPTTRSQLGATAFREFLQSHTWDARAALVLHGLLGK